MQIKTTQIKMATINTQKTTRQRGRRETGTIVDCCLQCKMVQPLQKPVWRFLKKLKKELSYNPKIPLLGIYSKELKIESQRDICTFMFTAALFTTAKSLKQLKHLLTEMSLVVQWLRPCDSNAWGTGSISSQELDPTCHNKRFHMPQLRPGTAK